MSSVDEKLDLAADKLEDRAQRMAAEGGVKAKLAEPLADDADFLRKVKPSLIKARAKGELPTDAPPGHVRVAPAGPQLGKRKKPSGNGGGPSPFVVAGLALVAGILLARWIDWRGDAHPRR